MVEAYVRALPEDLEVVVRPFRSTRSNLQNAYYWGVVVDLIAQETGYSNEEVHDLLRSLFLKKWVKINDEEIEVVGSTTSLKTDEFEKYLSQVRQWASMEIDVYVPLPREVEF